jgi:hypothetical protein
MLLCIGQCYSYILWVESYLYIISIMSNCHICELDLKINGMDEIYEDNHFLIRYCSPVSIRSILGWVISSFMVTSDFDPPADLLVGCHATVQVNKKTNWVILTPYGLDLLLKLSSLSKLANKLSNTGREEKGGGGCFKHRVLLFLGINIWVFLLGLGALFIFLQLC